MYAITSQTQEQAEKAVEEWKLQYTKMIGDPENEIVKYLKEKYLPGLVISFNEREEDYPNGMVQPGELVFLKGNKPIVAWRKNPNNKNANGAMGRPSAHKMWKYIEDCLKKVDSDSDSNSKQLECSNGKEFCSMGHLGYSVARYITGK